MAVQAETASPIIFALTCRMAYGEKSCPGILNRTGADGRSAGMPAFYIPGALETWQVKPLDQEMQAEKSPAVRSTAGRWR